MERVGRVRHFEANGANDFALSQIQLLVGQEKSLQRHRSSRTQENFRAQGEKHDAQVPDGRRVDEIATDSGPVAHECGGEQSQVLRQLGNGPGQVR